MVVTKVGGNPELLENGVTGILVSPKDPHEVADALLRLAHDATLRTSMGAAGKNRVEQHFSIDSCVQGYRRIYGSPIKNAP